MSRLLVEAEGSWFIILSMASQSREDDDDSGDERTNEAFLRSLSIVAMAFIVFGSWNSIETINLNLSGQIDRQIVFSLIDLDQPAWSCRSESAGWPSSLGSTESRSVAASGYPVAPFEAWHAEREWDEEKKGNETGEQFSSHQFENDGRNLPHEMS